jgi:hypothetical protein
MEKPLSRCLHRQRKENGEDVTVIHRSEYLILSGNKTIFRKALMRLRNLVISEGVFPSLLIRFVGFINSIDDLS